MGGEVWMLAEKGEARKVKAVLKESSYVGPKLPGSAFPCDFWVEWRGNRLELGYTIGGRANGEWAYAVALALCRRFKFRKAGWDSVGYCDTMEEFTRGRPFSADLKMFERAKGRLFGGMLARMVEATGYVDGLKKAQKAYEKAAAELVGMPEPGEKG